MFVCSSRIIFTLFFAVILLTAPRVAADSVYDNVMCSNDGGMTRLSVIREGIISKLSIFLSANITSQWLNADSSVQNQSRDVDPALMTTYQAVSQVLAEEDSAEPTECRKSDRGRGMPAFAKRISLFFASNVSVLYMPSQKKDDRKHADDDDDVKQSPTRYTFIFNPILPSQPFYSAELRLFKRITPRCKNIIFENVEVFHVEKHGEETELERTLVISKNVELFDDEYDSFDVSTAMKKWIATGYNESLELEVVINCPFSITSNKFSQPSIEFHTENGTSAFSEGFKDTRPQLVVATVTEEVATQLEKRRRRKRRQVVDTEYCNRNPNVVHCCIRNLDVNFHTDLNLPWVIYPRTFSPNYCQGLCPIPFLGEQTFRLTLQQFYQDNDLGGGPCCTIYSMVPLLMLIQDQANGDVIMLDVPNMEISSCGCVD